MRIAILGSASGLSDLLLDAGHQLQQSTVGAELVIIISDLEQARSLRAADAALPIFVLADDRVAALDAGADDAMSEPIMQTQFMGRVRALERRAALVPKPPEIIHADGCFIDCDRARASRAGPPVELSKREVDVLRWLHRNRQRAVSRAELLTNVFGMAADAQTRAVDMAIAVLRKKIERDPETPRIIVSVKGVGYAWGDLTQT